MFDVNVFKIDGINVYLIEDENNYILLFRSIKENYITSLKLMYGINESDFNESEIKKISQLINNRFKFDENLYFKSRGELLNYIQELT